MPMPSRFEYQWLGCHHVIPDQDESFLDFLNEHGKLGWDVVLVQNEPGGRFRSKVLVKREITKGGKS